MAPGQNEAQSRPHSSSNANDSHAQRRRSTVVTFDVPSSPSSTTARDGSNDQNPKSASGSESVSGASSPNASSEHSGLYTSLHSPHDDSPNPNTDELPRSPGPSAPMQTSVSAPAPESPAQTQFYRRAPPRSILQASPGSYNDTPGISSYFSPALTGTYGALFSSPNPNVNSSPNPNPHQGRPHAISLSYKRPLPMLFKDEQVREEFIRERMATMSTLTEDELERCGLKHIPMSSTRDEEVDGKPNGQARENGEIRKRGVSSASGQLRWDDDVHDFGDATKRPRRGVSAGMTRQGSTMSMYHATGLVNNLSGKYEKFRKSDEDLKRVKDKRVREFYKKQNEILDMFREVDELLDDTPTIQYEDITGETTSLLPLYNQNRQSKDDEANASVRLFININMVINILLLTGKGLVVLISNSISLLASVVDSAMDLLSTVILFGASKIIESKTWKGRDNYPVGLRRAEPMGVVVFSVFMIASFVQVFIESFQRLISKDLEMVQIPLQGIIVMLVTIGVKFVVWFTSRKATSSTIKALSQDAENDVVFNAMSLVFPYVGQKLGLAWLDPLGGLLLSLYIIVEWIRTLMDNITHLMGARRSPAEHQRVAYLVTRFSPIVKALQHVEVYACGDQFITEVDLVLPPNTSLPQAHCIGESVQYALESLSGIERAYCHVDYRRDNPYGHVVR